jgi:Uma2 family endonuclease
MSADPKQRYISAQEYLRAERVALERHEYIDGYVYPRDYPPGSHHEMAGASKRHVRLTNNLQQLLDTHLGTGPCEAYSVEIKVVVPTAAAYFYPDVVVTGDPRDRQFIDEIHHPVLIAEVLSPSTAAFDRGDKFAHYRQLETLREYVLVDTRRVCIDYYRRSDDGTWVFTSLASSDVLHIPALDFRCPVSRLYDRVDFAVPEVHLQEDEGGQSL